MQLEDSLNGSYHGLWGEVVERDVYRIQDLPDVVSVNDPTFIHEKGHPRGFDFTPDVIFDLGANVGIFSRYARTLFPLALIVAVEPDESNCKVFREFTKDEDTILIQAAVGAGKVYRCSGAVNGAHEVYLSENTGFDKSFFDANPAENIQTVNLPELYATYVRGGDRVMLKMDIEGNETVIFDSRKSMEVLKKIAYIAIELHYFAQDGGKLEAVKAVTEKALNSLSKTHRIERDHPYFYATKL